MRRFVSDLEAYRRSQSPRAPADANYLLGFLANGYTELRDWPRAEEANLRAASTGSPRRLAENAYANLAGISAMQGQWRRSLNYYGRMTGSRLLYEVVPGILFCLSWVVLWRVAKSSLGRGKKTFPPGAIWRLMLFACLPGIFFLFWYIGLPLHSYLFTGNAGTALVTHRTYSIVGIALSIEWAMLSLLIVYWVRRRNWVTLKEPDDDQIASDLTLSSKGISPAKRWLAPIGRTIVIIGIGLWLGRAGSPSVGEMFLNWNTYIHVIQRENVIDFLWVVYLLSTCVLSPIAQEMLDRGTIYAYARQVGEVGFGLAFSSFVFAATHILSTADEMPMLIVAGVVYACQYEFTRRLWPSIVTHSIWNFLAVIGQSGSPR